MHAHKSYSGNSLKGGLKTIAHKAAAPYTSWKTIAGHHPTDDRRYYIGSVFHERGRQMSLVREKMIRAASTCWQLLRGEHEKPMDSLGGV